MIDKSNGLNYYKMLIDDINSNKINAFELGLVFHRNFGYESNAFIYDLDEHRLIDRSDYANYLKDFSLTLKSCPYPVITLAINIETVVKNKMKQMLIDNVLYHENQVLSDHEDDFISIGENMLVNGIFDSSKQSILSIISSDELFNLFSSIAMHDDLFNFFFEEIYNKIIKDNFKITLNSFFKGYKKESVNDESIGTSKISNVLHKLFYLSIASLKRGKINDDVATAQIVSIFNICNEYADYETRIVEGTKELFLFLKSHANDNFSKDNINSIISTYQAIERKNFEK